MDRDGQSLSKIRVLLVELYHYRFVKKCAWKVKRRLPCSDGRSRAGLYAMQFIMEAVERIAEGRTFRTFLWIYANGAARYWEIDPAIKLVFHCALLR